MLVCILGKYKIVKSRYFGCVKPKVQRIKPGVRLTPGS